MKIAERAGCRQALLLTQTPDLKRQSTPLEQHTSKSRLASDSRILSCSVRALLPYNYAVKSTTRIKAKQASSHPPSRRRANRAVRARNERRGRKHRCHLPVTHPPRARERGHSALQQRSKAALWVPGTHTHAEEERGAMGSTSPPWWGPQMPELVQRRDSMPGEAAGGGEREGARQQRGERAPTGPPKHRESAPLSLPHTRPQHPAHKTH